MGLWYLKDSGFELTAFLDADHVGRLDTRKSTSGGIQFFGDKLMRNSIRMLVKDTRSQDDIDDKNNDKGSKSRSQSMKEQTYNKEQRERPRPHELNDKSNLIDLMKEYAIMPECLENSKNHFWRKYSSLGDKLVSWVVKGNKTALQFLQQAAEYVRYLLDVLSNRTEYNKANIFTKALPEYQFKYLVRRIGMRCLTPADLEVLTNETA
ncbi:hypothetical protein Tco_0608735 [Tanacetum coccineum]